MSKKVLLIISHVGGPTYKGEAFLHPDGTFTGTGPLEKIEDFTLEMSQGVRETMDDEIMSGNMPDFRTFEKHGLIEWGGTIK